MTTTAAKGAEPKLNTYSAGPDDQGFFGGATELRRQAPDQRETASTYRR